MVALGVINQLGQALGAKVGWDFEGLKLVLGVSFVIGVVPSINNSDIYNYKNQMKF